MKSVALIFLAIAAVDCACHGPHCSGVDQNVVDNAITNINLHYNDDLCLEILLIDCSKHVTAGHEVLCASNGNTYDNHCKFAHARCEYMFNHQSQPHGGTRLTVASIGPCDGTVVMTTSAPGVTYAQTTGAPGSGSTAAPVVGTTPSGMTTHAPGTAGTAGPIVTTAAVVATTTAAPATTTADQINSIIQSVFCQQVDSINCSNGFKIVCASNGQFYPNDCELSKAKCKDPTLTIDPVSSNCSV